MRRDFPREVKRADHATSDALLTEAVKALKPFADIAIAHERRFDAKRSVYFDEGLPPPPPQKDCDYVDATLGDCRHARATLSKIKAEAK